MPIALPRDASKDGPSASSILSPTPWVRVFRFSYEALFWCFIWCVAFPIQNINNINRYSGNFFSLWDPYGFQ